MSDCLTSEDGAVKLFRNVGKNYHSTLPKIPEERAEEFVDQLDDCWLLHPTILFQYRTREAMYVKRNIEARSCNYCYIGKAINSTYSERMFSLICPA